jgi:hypothetical protein
MARKQPCTRYEVELTNGQRHYLVGYSIKRNRLALIAAMIPHAERIIALAELTLPLKPQFRGARSLELGNGWLVRFTGRTQRSAQTTVELEFIAA